MSGIAGIFHLDGRPVDPRLLEAMSARMAHRGPDGSGSWIDGPVGLAHRMLHSTPESLREVQPLHDESGQLVLVLDGRIDDRDELKAAIESAGGRLRDDTDAELVLKSYECWAEDCPKHLLGDFAFALWDARKRRLFCARDPLGNKPFFYRCDGKTFFFASEMQPLFADTEFPPQVNLKLLGMFLNLDYGDFTETLYQDVMRLSAAHVLIVEGGSFRKVRYWEVDPGRSITYRTDDEYAEHFLDLFRKSVRANLRASGPVAASLSGGLDSPSIVCTAAALARDGLAFGTRVVAFSQVYPGLACDESPYIQDVTRKWGLELVTFPADAEPSAADFEHSSDYPDVFYGVTRFMFAPAMRQMHHRGIRVLLEGLGGDELLVTGFGHLAHLARRGRWLVMLRQLRSDAANYSLTPSWLLVHEVLKPLLPSWAKRALWPLRRRFFQWKEGPLVRPEFHRSRAKLPGVGVPSFATAQQQILYRSVYYQWSALSSEWNELFAARFGIECRWPFLERRLFEFMLALPQEQRWRGDQSKYLLRRAMVGILPEGVRRRKSKTSFAPILNLELGERRADKIEALLRDSVVVEMGVGDRNGWDGLLRKYRAGAGHEAAMVEFLVQLELFCRAAHGRIART